jgi:Glycosyl hydrolase family 1
MSITAFHALKFPATPLEAAVTRQPAIQDRPEQPDFGRIYGFGNRFGIVYVDFKTQKRTPKLSAQWCREAARRNAVV